MSAFLMLAFQTAAVASGAPLVMPLLRFWGICFQGLRKLGMQSPTTCTGTLQRTGNTANTSSPVGLLWFDSGGQLSSTTTALSLPLSSKRKGEKIQHRELEV